MIFVLMKLFHSSFEYAPTPKTNDGMPNIDATVSLSTFTDSCIAKSSSVSGLIVSNLTRPSGSNKGLFLSLRFKYFSSNFSRSSSSKSASLSTIITKDGIYSLDMNDRLVALA